VAIIFRPFLLWRPNFVLSLCATKFGFPSATCEAVVGAYSTQSSWCWGLRIALKKREDAWSRLGFDWLPKAQCCPLIRPDQRKVHEALDPQATRQSTLDARLY